MSLVEFTEELTAKTAERRLGQNTSCSSEKSGILVFRAFKGHYGEKVTLQAMCE
jgi:hypothetical protein